MAREKGTCGVLVRDTQVEGAEDNGSRERRRAGQEKTLGDHQGAAGGAC